LQADFSRRALVYEFHDGTPGIPLSFIPQSGAARSDAPLGGNTGHFGVYEPGAAHGAVAVMNEVPIVRHAVLGAVLRHWGNHDAVGQFEVAELERQKHRRARLFGAAVGCQPAFVVRHEARIAQLQVFMADALAAREQAVGKLLRRQVRVARDVLEPLHPIARGALQLEHLDVTLLVVGAEGAVQAGAAGDVVSQRDGVFHGELRARAY
jgi:hypothetical protein